jgi:hypothetical protein
VSSYCHWQWCVLSLLPVYMHVMNTEHGLWALALVACTQTIFRFC